MDKCNSTDCINSSKLKGLCKKHYDLERKKDPEVRRRISEQKKIYRNKNKDKISKEYKDWYQSQGREYDRNRGLLYRYGIDTEQYNKFLIQQKYCCAICKSQTPGDDNYNFHVDHCHKTGEIRGLLCNLCNKMLGYAKDNIEVLNNASKYLENFVTPKVKQVIIIRKKFINSHGQEFSLRRGKEIAQARAC